MKEMLDSAYSESVVSLTSVYRCYNELKSGRKSVELMGGPGTPTTLLTKLTINTRATMNLNNPYLIVR